MAKTVEAAAIISAKDLTGPAFASASRHAKGFQRASAGFARQVKAQTTAVIGFGKAVGAALGISAAAAVYKLNSAFKETAESLDQLDELSKQVGMKAGHIQILTQIAKKEGISGEQVQQSIKNVSQAYVTLQRNLRGSKQLTAAFPGLSQQIKNAQSVEEAVSIALTAMDKMSPENALKWSKMMFGNEDFSKLRKNMQTWRAEMREAKRLGGWVSPEMTKAAADYNDSMDDLGTALQSVITPATAEIAKMMTPIVRDMTEWTVQNREWMKTGIVDGAKGFKRELQDIVKLFSTLFGLNMPPWLKSIDDFFKRYGPFTDYSNKPSTYPHPSLNPRMLNRPPGMGAPPEMNPRLRQQLGIGGGSNIGTGAGRGSEGGYGGTDGWKDSGLPGGVDSAGLPREANALLAGIASTEAGKHGYRAINYMAGGGAFSGKGHPFKGQKGYTAAGMYQILASNWERLAQKLGLDVNDYGPANQKKAAWQLAKDDYKDRTGRNLEQDVRDPNRRGYIMEVLAPTWHGLRGSGARKARRVMEKSLAAERVTAVEPLPNDRTTAAYLKRRKGKPRNQLGTNMSVIQGGSQQPQVHQIGKGQVDLNIRVGGQPVKVERIRVQQPDLMTLNTGVDNTGARHYRPGAPMLGPI